jgi:uncharacterized protein YeaO (DUF488 family)
MVTTKRVYDPPGPDDGYRVLIDRLWPRGMSKARAHFDAWLRDLGPSPELRRWFGHDPARWEEFRRQYQAELSRPEKQALIEDLVQRARHGTLTLLYGSREQRFNDATVLQELIEGELAK